MDNLPQQRAIQSPYRTSSQRLLCGLVATLLGVILVVLLGPGIFEGFQGPLSVSSEQLSTIQEPGKELNRTYLSFEPDEVVRTGVQLITPATAKRPEVKSDYVLFKAKDKYLLGLIVPGAAVRTVVGEVRYWTNNNVDFMRQGQIGDYFKKHTNQLHQLMPFQFDATGNLASQARIHASVSGLVLLFGLCLLGYEIHVRRKRAAFQAALAERLGENSQRYQQSQTALH